LKISENEAQSRYQHACLPEGATSAQSGAQSISMGERAKLYGWAAHRSRLRSDSITFGVVVTRMRIIAGKSPNHNRPVTTTFSGFLPVGSVRREVVPCLDYPDRVRVILILAMVGFMALALVGLVGNTIDDSQTVLAGLDDLRLRFMPFVNNVPLCRYRKLVQVMM
jgi:hypothetical protein